MSHFHCVVYIKIIVYVGYGELLVEVGETDSIKCRYDKNKGLIWMLNSLLSTYT
jgi:hypothetical protein